MYAWIILPFRISFFTDENGNDEFEYASCFFVPVAKIKRFSIFGVVGSKEY